MFEKVNPSHPDKIADRIAGAIVDLAYERGENPRIAVEVLIGHHVCNIIAETSVSIPESTVIRAVQRIAGDVHVIYRRVPQDAMLANNQEHGFRCGDRALLLGHLPGYAAFKSNDKMEAHKARFSERRKAAKRTVQKDSSVQNAGDLKTDSEGVSA